MTSSEFVALPAGRFRYLRWRRPGPSRPPAVLLHANAGCAESWIRIGPALSDRFEVYGLDLRGHGGSVRPPTGQYGLREAADDVRAFLSALGLTRAVLIGHSWGAAVALVAATQPGPDGPGPGLGPGPGPGPGLGPGPGPGIGAVVLEDPPAEMSPGRFGAEMESLLRVIGRPPAVLRRLTDALCADWHPDDRATFVSTLSRAEPYIARSIVHDGAVTGALPPLLAELTVPALVLRADPARGGLLREHEWHEVLRFLPAHATALDLPGVPHEIHRARTSLFLSAIRDFTASLSLSPDGNLPQESQR